jgi:hypothetical protein
MLKDMCITVDETDKVLGAVSKQDSHRFVVSNPTGHLHRAFSVFLFDGQNRLLIQQRAADKVTFPGVWHLDLLYERPEAQCVGCNTRALNHQITCLLLSAYMAGSSRQCSPVQAAYST